ncbi:MAG: riboflavin kinase [Pseudomonadaceae bacterium]|nr:riboflavin kinase [Pseudomonadaceae bacterium]
MRAEYPTLEGVVVQDARLGRTLGFPTANLDASNYSAPNGVYVVTVEALGAVMHGVANLGRKPTVGSAERLMEVHILDFKGDLYGSMLTVTPVYKLRDEVRFESVEAMAEQVHRDIDRARGLLV